MPFHEIRFPPRLSLGSSGGPERFTEIVTLANGFEERNTPWAHSRRRYDAGLGVRSFDDVAEIVAFFEARRAKLHGFRWKDWLDFKSCSPSQKTAATDQQIGIGDDLRSTFVLQKTYLSGAEAYTRPIAKPVAGTVRIAIDGEELDMGRVTVDHATGTVAFEIPPPTGAAITAGFEFDVPVRFDTDSIITSATSFEAGELPDVPVVEIRV